MRLASFRLAGIFLLLMTVLGLSPAHASSEIYAKTSVDVEFVKRFPAGQPRFVAVDESDGRIYTTQMDGTVRVFDQNGKPVMTIADRTADGTRVLRMPTGITLYQGRIYVTDEWQNTVSVFRKDGSFIESFGSGGSGPKEFRSPQGIRVNQGIIYVADKDNRRIQLFGLDGVFLRSFGSADKDADALQTPTDIDLLPNGDIYVADTRASNVKLFGPDYSLKSKVERVANPFSVTVYKEGFLVSDPEMVRVTMHNFRGDLIFGFGGRGLAGGTLQSMAGIYLDAKLNIYIADPRSGFLHVYRMKNIEPAVKNEYPPPTSVRWVKDIKTSVGRIYWDRKESVLYAIDKDTVIQLKEGKVQKRIEVDGWRPSGLALDRSGMLWVSDRGRGRLLKMGPDGKVLQEVGSSGSASGRMKVPEDIVISHEGLIYVADTGDTVVKQYTADGLFIRNLGEGGTSSFFRRPIALAIDQDGILYVLDGKRREVLVFSQNGLPLSEFGKDAHDRLMFDEPVDLAVNNEELFVLDAGLRQVLVFDHRGKYVRRFGAPGTQRGDFKGPESIDTVGMSRVLVSDTSIGRIQELSFIYTPDVVQGVQAEGGMREAVVRWEPSPEAYVERYIVYRSDTLDGSFEPLGQTGETIYTDPALEPGKTYYYRVAAVAVDGNESPGSGIVGATPEKYVPERPSGVNAKAGESSINIVWRKADSPYVKGYVVYRRPLDGPAIKVGETDGLEFTDEGLKSNTSYIYQVASLSIDGEESPPARVQVTTQVAGGSPLQIDVVALDDVFSNVSQLYQRGGMGRVRLTNASKTSIADITVFFKIDEFMDGPVRMRVDVLQPGEEAELELVPAFNLRMQDVTVNTDTNLSITALFALGGQDMRLSVNRTVTVYEKHATVWDEDGRMATFIDPEDAAMREYVRSLAEQYDDTTDQLVLGGMLYDALGTAGVLYQPDPKNPYRKTSGNSTLVDHVQYPPETLQLGGGDNDDLVALYATVLESVGMPVKILFYPGHMFMMFSIGYISETGGQDLDGKLLRDGGRVWVPVDVTYVGSSFLKAWEKGAESYHEWKDRGLRVLDLRPAWERFSPASVQLADWHPPLAFRELVTQKYPADFKSLVRFGLLLRTAGYAHILRQRPNDADAIMQMGILYARSGEITDATRQFNNAAELIPASAALKNNLGNLRFLTGDYEEACRLYQDATELDAKDALAWVNLARCLARVERYKDAKNAFNKAYKLDKSVPRTYRRMSLDLLGGF